MWMVRDDVTTVVQWKCILQHDIIVIIILKGFTVRCIFARQEWEDTLYGQKYVDQRKLTEHRCRALKREECKYHPCSVALLATELQTASGSNNSTRIVHQELRETGLQGRAAPHEPKTTVCSGVKCQDWTLERFSGVMMKSDGRIWVWWWCQKNASCWNVHKVRRSKVWGCFSGFGKLHINTYIMVWDVQQAQVW